MRIAIIDLGTNTFNLLIAHLSIDNGFTVEFSDKIAVKLGEGGINSDTILPLPFARGIAAIGAHLETIKRFDVETIQAFATSAIRSARNGAAFVKQVKDNFLLEVEVIDGDKEATLIYEGVRMGVTLTHNNSLIMDIGGGSTEFIIGNATEILWKQSFNLGAARLLEKFKPHDPILEQEVKAIEHYFNTQLQSLSVAIEEHGVTELIGSSGSFDTFAEMIGFKFYTPIDLNRQTSYDFCMNDFYSIHQQLLLSNKVERLQTPGIIEMRADMIVVSAVFTNYILTRYSLSNMRLSTYALKEGVIANRMRTLHIN
ncbi:MAG: exopolyphosphatase [Bacteroidetes bacterium]|nr:exopolyphosphatase [Bacteroidota bacterium]